MVFIVVDFVHHDDDKTDEHQGQAYRVHYPMQHHPAHPGHFGADVRLARDAEHRFRYQETHSDGHTDGVPGEESIVSEGQSQNVYHWRQQEDMGEG